MEYALIILKQTVVMFLYMMAGYILFRTEKMSIKGSRDIAALLVWVVIPAVIVNSFCAEYSHERMIQLVQSTLLSAGGICVAMIIASVLFKKHPIDNFASSFSNAGFIGIPLVQAAFGDKGVFYVVAIVAMMNMLQWSYGVKTITGKRSAIGIRHLTLNPIFISIIIGLFLFLTGIGSHLPMILSSTLSGLSALNAPLAMIVLGAYLAQVDLKKMLKSAHLYWMCTVRLIMIPLVTMLLFSFIPVSPELKMAIFIALSTPAGANVAVYAQLYDSDYPYACQTVTMSTLLSIITLPLMILAASLL